jgi:nucleotide-binding universal stress UspA family protein
MNILLVLSGLVAVALVWVVMPIAVSAVALWRRPWRLVCPRAGRPARIQVSAVRAAVSEVFGRPTEIERCSLWPGVLGCRQECLALPAGARAPMLPGAPPPRDRAGNSMRMIVVPLDGARGSESVLPAVADLAKACGATVRLLRVLPPAGEVRDDDDRLVAFADQETARMDGEARDYLQRAATLLAGVAVEETVRVGDVAAQVLEEAETTGADLIAMASHRRRGLARLLRGSVTGRLERTTTIPMLVVRYGEAA